MLPKTPFQLNSEHWNAIIAGLPGAHILQTWEWGKVKSQFGWQPHHLIWLFDQGEIQLVTSHQLEQMKNKQLVAAALVLQRNITIGGFSHRMGVMYVPKGPVLNWDDIDLRLRVMSDLKHYAERHSAIFIKIDPDVEIGNGEPGTDGAVETQQGQTITTELKKNGWQFSDEQVQFRNTVLLDLRPTEEELLANMKQKTRYNVNLAIRKGVSIRLGQADDMAMLFKMYAETSIRDGFVIRNEGYYRELWSAFMHGSRTRTFEQPIAEALVAEVDGEPIAGAILFRFAQKAWYLYGMSKLAHREKMPNYLLQWEAIKRLKAANCQIYDLWGGPDEFIESDPLWGVYRFKEGLGGTVKRYIGAWDLPINRILYRLYSKTLPGLLDIMRKHGKATTKQAIG